MPHYLLAIDQGTTNSRAIIFNQNGNIVSEYYLPVTQYYPQAGWVEQDPEEMVQNIITCCRQALQMAKLAPQSIAAIGISNQRETTIIWDKHTGKAIYPAIVWLDRRTSAYCRKLSQTQLNDYVREKTGLLIDPYFSATKINWILEHVPHANDRAARGELLFGTVDTFLLWKLTKHKNHATDATNASRTLLFNIHTQQWDEKILASLNIPRNLLPTVLDNTAHFGELDENILGIPIPITGMVGDQQAATIGQACFQPGMIKATYGTGCFLLLNTGNKIIQSQNKLLSTIAYRFPHQVTYGLEGSIFSAGITVKWLRDTLKIIKTAAETENLSSSIASTEGVYLVPAFTGLGAPYWDPDARGMISGLTLRSDKTHIVRAALENIAYQTRDLLEAMMIDTDLPLTKLRVDGGMVVNNWLMQFLASILNLEVERPHCIETTALGAAYLAGLQIGMFPSLNEISKLWQGETHFLPTMPADQRETLYAGWKTAVKRVRVSEFPLSSN